MIVDNNAQISPEINNIFQNILVSHVMYYLFQTTWKSVYVIKRVCCFAIQKMANGMQANEDAWPHLDPLESPVCKFNLTCVGNIYTPVTLVTSSSSIHICDPQTLSIRSSHSLFDLIRFQVSGTLFRLEFTEKTYEFETTEPVDKIIHGIAHSVVQICSPDEYPEFPKYLVKKNESLPFKMFMRRFTAKLRQYNRPIDKSTIRKLKAYVNTRPRVFEADYFPEMDDFFDILLETLHVEPTIVGLRVSSDPQHRKWRLLAEKLWKNRHIRSLKAGIPTDSDFEEFVRKWGDATHHNLQILCLANVAIESRTLELIRPLVECGRIACLGLEKVDLVDNAETVLRDMLSCEDVKLKAVNFSTMLLDRHFSLVEGLFSRLQVITLRGCALELLVLLRVMEKSHVHVCDLSACSALHPLDNDISLPLCLKRLVLNDVVWMPENIVHILKLVGGLKECHLSLGNAKVQEGRWNKFFEHLRGVEPGNLCSFVWMNNPVSGRLCKFLLQAKALKFLSLARCDIKYDSKKVQQLLRSHPSIVALDLHGITNSAKIIKLLLGNVQIERLDISNNKLGKEGLHLIIELITRMRANAELLIYNDGFNDEESLGAIASAITGRGKAKPIYVSKPVPITHTNKKQLAAFIEYHNRDSKVPYHEEWRALLAQDYRSEEVVERPTDAMVREVRRRSLLNEAPVNLEVSDDSADLECSPGNDCEGGGDSPERGDSPDVEPPPPEAEEVLPVNEVKVTWTLNVSEPQFSFDNRELKARFTFERCMSDLQEVV